MVYGDTIIIVFNGIPRMKDKNGELRARVNGVASRGHQFHVKSCQRNGCNAEMRISVYEPKDIQTIGFSLSGYEFYDIPCKIYVYHGKEEVFSGDVTLCHEDDVDLVDNRRQKQVQFQQQYDDRRQQPQQQYDDRRQQYDDRRQQYNDRRQPQQQYDNRSSEYPSRFRK